MERIIIEVYGDDLPDPEDLAYNVYEMLEKDGYEVSVKGEIGDITNE